MAREITSGTELETLKDILMKYHGVVFYPNRGLVAPAIEREFVASIVGEKRADDAMKALEATGKYLKKIPIADGFGPNHTERKKWRDDMEREYGKEAFQLVYDEPNQFRTNNMMSSIPYIEIMEDYALESKNFDIGIKLDIIFQSWFYRSLGLDPKTLVKVHKSYQDLQSYDERFGFVHYTEDIVLEALNLFTSPK